MFLLICALIFAVAAADDYDGGYGRRYRSLSYRPSYGVGNLGYGVGNLGYGNLGGYGVPDIAYFGGNTLGNRVYGRISTPYGLNLNYGGRLGSGNLGYGLGSYGFPGYGGIGSGLGGYGFPGYGGVGYGYGRPDVAYFNGNTHGNRVYGSISTPYGLNIPYGNNIGLGFNPFGSGYGINPYGSLGGGYGVSPYLTGGYGSPALYSSYVPSRRIRRKKY